jgi:hypothetical protein
MANEVKTIDNLKPYDICSVKYPRPSSIGEKLVTSRAAYLGAFNKQDFNFLKFPMAESETQTSVMANYLGRWFLTYSCRSGPTETSDGREFFDFLFCHFEKGLVLPTGEDVITLVSGYVDVKTIYPDSPLESSRNFAAITKIASKIGLIDLGLGTLPPVSKSRTGTEIRQINRDAGLTRIVQCAP